MFSVIAGGQVLEVVVRRPTGNGQQQVDLVNSSETIFLGYVIRIPTRLTPAWAAFGYYPNEAILRPSRLFDGQLFRKIEKTEGFATRGYAIEHMLRRCGWRADD